MREIRSFGQDTVSLETPTGTDGDGGLGDRILDARALAESSNFGSRASEIRYASDWAGEKG